METELIRDQAKLPDGTDLQNGRYTIRVALGNGGFGITYKAWDNRLRRYVAVKEFFPAGIVYRDIYNGRDAQCFQDPRIFQRGKRRFRREAQTLANLDFPHIVKVYDSFEENNTAYIVMEYIEGVTLAQYVEKNGPMPGARLLELFLPLMCDLDAVHKNGLIHRDISPDNIMLTEESGRLKLIDFGTAKDLAPSDEKSRGYSMTHSVVRINYSPIELFSSAEKLPPADIYSLCATMYFCLTGEEPPASLDRAFNDTLKAPSASVGSVNKNLDKAILKGLSLKPEDRYASVEKLMQALAEKQPRVSAKKLRPVAAVLASIALLTVVVLLITGKQKPAQTQPGQTLSEPVEAAQTPSAEPLAETEPETGEQEAETLQAEITAAESAFGEPVSVIRLTGRSDMDVYTYQTAAAQIEPQTQALTDGKYRIWTDSTGVNTYILLPNSLFGQENPARFLRETAVVLRVSGETYFYAGTDNYKRIQPSDIVDASLQKDAQGQDEIYLRLTDAAAERVSGVFDDAQDGTASLYMDPWLTSGGTYLIHADGYNNLFRDENDPTVFHCYGNYDLFGDAQVKIAQTFLDVMRADNTGGALESKIIYTPEWEPAAGSEAGTYQVESLEEPAIRAMYSFNRSRGSEDPESWEPAVKELKKRLDLLGVPYVFGQAAIDGGIIFVELPQSEVPYEALELLLENEIGISVGTPFWNTSYCDYAVLPDGGIRAEVHSWAEEDLRPGFTDLINGTVDSQPVYLFVSCVAQNWQVLQADLTAYPEDGNFEFRKLLLHNADGTWDGAGFMQLLGYIAEHGEVDSALSGFMLSEVTFVNGAKGGYLVSARLEEQERLRSALAGEYPDVDVVIKHSILPQLQIHFNFDIDAQLPAKTLEASQCVYDLVKDGSVDTVKLVFIEEENAESCHAVFSVDSFFTHRMKLSSFSFEGGRLERYEEDFRSLYASSTFIQSLEDGTAETAAVSGTSPEESLTMDDAGYYLFQEDTYGVSCPFPADFAIDQNAAGETLLMRANSTVNRNYIEVHGKMLTQVTTGEQALQSAEKELGGHVNFQSYGDSWFACSVDQSGVGIYRKGKLRANGTIVVWFDYFAIDDDESHAAHIDYMESKFTSSLQ